MNSQISLIALALLSGILVPVQAASNAALSKAIGSPIATALIVFIVGFLSILTYIFITKTPFPEISLFKSTPLYAFTGGLIIAFYVIVITFITRQLGVAASIGLIISGQLIGAVIIDHFGLFDTAIKTIDLKRLAGTLCIVTGIYLIMKR